VFSDVLDLHTHTHAHTHTHIICEEEVRCTLITANYGGLTYIFHRIGVTNFTGAIDVH
jgi:hypothetical protein